MANNDAVSTIPCCPELIKDDQCDVFKFSRVLTYPTTITATNRQKINVEVLLHFKLTRCTLGLTLGDPVYSTSLLPGEKVRLATTDRRSRFTYDSETKISYRSEQISEEQYYLTSVQKYMADAATSQSGHSENSSGSDWSFHGDAGGSIIPILFSASASTNAKGTHNSHSVSDYLNQQKSHVQTASAQAVSSTRKAHSVSVGEVNSRTHIQGETEDHFESSSREFSNPNKCHAVTFIFYRLNKKQKVKFELEAIERRVLDDSAPVSGVLLPPIKNLPIAVVPQDIPATAFVKRTGATAAGISANLNSAIDVSALNILNPNAARQVFTTDQNIGIPIDGELRNKALKEVDDQLANRKLIDNKGKVTQETKLTIDFESEFSLPTAGILVKGCLDDCDICEPLVKERMQLENDLLRKQIELLEKSQQYRCCAEDSVAGSE